MKTELTIEQSAELIELGVDPKLASRWVKYGERIFDKNPQSNPIFTFTDILSILPKEIGGINLVMGYGDGEWCATYNNIKYIAGCSFAPELIDALHKLLVRTLKKGYIKLNQNEK